MTIGIKHKEATRILLKASVICTAAHKKGKTTNSFQQQRGRDEK